MTSISKHVLNWRVKALLLIAVLLLMMVFLLFAINSWDGQALLADIRAARLEGLRQQAAEELNDYYRGEGDWFRCYRLLKKIERLEAQ